MATTQDSSDNGIGGFKHGRVPRRLREQQMLDVAEEVFTECGYDGASIEEVCRRAGLKRPLVYTYFGGKEGLYLACYRRARAELDDRLAAAATAAASQTPTPQALRKIVESIVRAYFDFLTGSPGRWEMLYGGGAATAGPIAAEVTNLRMRTVDLLAAVIRHYAAAEVDDDTILAFAHAGSGSAEQLARWWRQTPHLSIERLAEVATRYTWAALEPLLSA